MRLLCRFWVWKHCSCNEDALTGLTSYVRLGCNLASQQCHAVLLLGFAQYWALLCIAHVDCAPQVSNTLHVCCSPSYVSDRTLKFVTGSWTPDMHTSVSVDDSDVQKAQCQISNQGADRAAGLSGRATAYCPPMPAQRSQASFQYMLPLSHYSLSSDSPEV